jgi:hypothetical protein
VIDRETEQSNEMGEASHEAYKRRQQAAVARRLKVGREPDRETPPPPEPPQPRRSSRPAPGLRKRKKTR